MIRNIALLGSTGSIGKNTIDVVRKNRDRFRIISLVAGRNVDLLIEQIREFKPKVVVVNDNENFVKLRKMFEGVKFYLGNYNIEKAVNDSEVDTLVSAISGTIPLRATLKSIELNHRICLANKETLVAAGDIINKKLKESKSELIPIDSEQSAIFQSLCGVKKDFVKKIILTASGGPFFRKTKEEFDKIKVKDALKHPTWSMGKKITIDSATLMNKGLEIIEASYLFELEGDKIDVLIHPQSIVHSMVELIDSSIISQMSVPDMRIPILYSLTYPQRVEFDNYINFKMNTKLEFYEVNRDLFPSIDMAYYVLKNRGNTGIIFNTSNEVAVECFLEGKITFVDIFKVVSFLLYNEEVREINNINEVEEEILRIRNKTIEIIEKGEYL